MISSAAAMTERTNIQDITPYTTLDGSEIYELMHPRIQGNSHQSLAMARVLPGQSTRLHKHLVSEELYHVLAGAGLMTLDGDVFSVRPGDTICIAPGQAHCLENTENQDLVVLCCCSPAYSHAETELL